MKPRRAKPMSWARRLAISTCGTMVLTMSQAFMGALTIGIATFRGTQAYESFYYETQLGHANYATSKLGGDHARSANSVANNNVISASIMGPRFAVEGDNITMIVNALIACPQIYNPHMVTICAEFHANYWRMLAKLIWSRVQQKLIWGTLGKLSSAVDGIASLKALEQVKSTIKPIDSAVNIRVQDPSTSGSIWGGDSTGTSCSMSGKDALLSPMPGAAFPVLMENLLAGLPRAMVQIMPRVICGVTSALEGAIKLPQIPSVAKKTNEDCSSLEQQMQAQLSGGAGNPFGGWGGVGSTRPTFSGDLGKYVQCGVQSPSSPGPGGASGFAFRGAGGGGQLTTCTFDWTRCNDDKLGQNSSDFLQSVGLPKLPNLSSLGGATQAPTDSDWNHSDTMRACAYASKPIHPGVTSLNDAVRTLVSFGTAPASTTLRESHEYRSCSKWYFPDGSGDFASVPHEHHPFTAAWKFALVAGHVGGG
jgi:hypothetical protein